MADLHDIYKTEDIGIRGEQADVKSYLTQNFQGKLLHYYGDIKVGTDCWRINLIFASNVPEGEALLRLHTDEEEHNEQNDKFMMNNSASMPKDKIPNPATV